MAASGSDSQRTIGLIAGGGRLPVLMAEGIRASGCSVACLGLSGQYQPELPGMCQRFRKVGVLRIGQWMRVLRRWNVDEAVMVGRVAKARMYDPLRLFRQLPDWRAMHLWYRVLRHDKRTETVLRAVADEMASEGITLIDSTRYIPDHMAGAGLMTRHKPTNAEQADIDFGLPLAVRLNELGIGQAIAVKEREVIAVEAMEGTDELIKRAGKLCRSGKWTLIKIASHHKDMRFDVPTVGLATIDNLKANGASCLAVETGRVILLDRPKFLEAADRAGISVVGVNVTPGAG